MEQQISISISPSLPLSLFLSPSLPPSPSLSLSPPLKKSINKKVLKRKQQLSQLYCSSINNQGLKWCPTVHPNHRWSEGKSTNSRIPHHLPSLHPECRFQIPTKTSQNFPVALAPIRLKSSSQRPFLFSSLSLPGEITKQRKVKQNQNLKKKKKRQQTYSIIVMCSDCSTN